MQLKFKLRYTGIEVANLDRSVDFYTRILGMRLTKRVKVKETEGEFAILKSEGSDHWLEINWYSEHEYRPGSELDHIAFEVEDLDQALAELRKFEISPGSYMRESEGARWTYITDPDGIWVELFQRK